MAVQLASRFSASWLRELGSLTAQVGGTGWKTLLFPKDGRYIVPVKTLVRKAEGLDVGDMVTVRLAVDA